MDDNQMADIRRSRLKDWMEHRGLSGTSVASKLGTSRAYVSGLLKPEKNFGEKAARSIEQKLHMPTGYLDSKVSGLSPVDVWESPSDLPSGAYALVPRIGIRLSAGAGTEAVEQTELPPLAFRESWLKRKNVTSRSNLRVLDVKGDSMEPYLMDGDIVLIDMGQKQIVDGDVYALAYGDELRIKRLSKRFDGGLIIRSDNPRFPEETIAPSDLEHVRVIGRHIWRGG